MGRGWVVCTHILSRIILLHLFPQTRPTPQAAQTDERGEGQKDGDGERESGRKFNDTINDRGFRIFKYAAVTSPGTHPITGL